MVFILAPLVGMARRLFLNRDTAGGAVFVLASLVGMARRMFPPRLRRGTRHPDAPPSPRSASESVRVTTLRALPENTACHLG